MHDDARPATVLGPVPPGFVRALLSIGALPFTDTLAREARARVTREVEHARDEFSLSVRWHCSDRQVRRVMERLFRKHPRPVYGLVEYLATRAR